MEEGVGERGKLQIPDTCVPRYLVVGAVYPHNKVPCKSSSRRRCVGIRILPYQTIFSSLSPIPPSLVHCFLSSVIRFLQ